MKRKARFASAILLGLFSATIGIAQRRADDDSLTPVTAKTDLYSAEADAKKEIDEALKNAGEAKKRVILLFGANWCYDCHVLDQAFHEGEAGRIVKDHFLLVHVDIGEGKKNLDLVEKYQTTLDKGVPTLVVLDARGQVVFSSTHGEFEPARLMLKRDLVSFLNRWKSTAR
jgi:thiol:disulfide interchange protein